MWKSQPEHPKPNTRHPSDIPSNGPHSHTQTERRSLVVTDVRFLQTTLWSTDWSRASRPALQLEPRAWTVCARPACERSVKLQLQRVDATRSVNRNSHHIVFLILSVFSSVTQSEPRGPVLHQSIRCWGPSAPARSCFVLMHISGSGPWSSPARRARRRSCWSPGGAVGSGTYWRGAPPAAAGSAVWCEDTGSSCRAGPTTRSRRPGSPPPGLGASDRAHLPGWRGDC